jgi:hypothetical protein
VRDIKDKPKIVNRYVTSSDLNSDLITQGIAREIKQLTGKIPYVVMAKFLRKSCIPPPEIAYDSPAAAPFYEHYHRSIRKFVDELRTTSCAGLLIDIHTQGKIPGALVRGTLNGRAVKKLLARAGVEAVTRRSCSVNRG